MATTTTNFGWDIPQSTDLVKDGATAIASLGQDIDTALIDLKGGTTGQILSKASATDLDYTWIANDVGDITGVTAGTGLSGGGTSGAVTVSIDTATTVDKTTAQTLTNKTLTSPVLTTPNISTYTTAGDVVYGTGSGALSRLGIGLAGQVLTVSAGVPAWAAAGGSSGLTLISTTTLSAVASQNFEGVFTSTYTNYKVIMNLASSVDGAVPQLQYLYSTNTAQSGGYYGGLCGFNYSGTANSDNVANTYSQTAYSLPATPITGGNLFTDFDMTFFKPNTSDSKANFNCAAKSGYTGWLYYGGGAQNTARAYTGFKIVPNSGTLTGTVSIYGLAK
jgi:hypothetical protein